MKSKNLLLGMSLLVSMTTMAEKQGVNATIQMRNDGDTIIYDASSFVVPEGCQLAALVRQLPGAEMKTDSTIFVNGREVNYLTLNGNDYFKGRHQVMLGNLPCYLVKEVKVYGRSSERSRLLGREVEQKDYVMDIVLKDGYAQGLAGEAEAGMGSDKRYMSRLFGTYGSDLVRASVFARADNVDETRVPGTIRDFENPVAKGGLKAVKNIGLSVSATNRDKTVEDIVDADVKWTDGDYGEKKYSEGLIDNGRKWKEFVNLQNVSCSMGVGVHNVFRFRQKDDLLHLLLHTNVSFDKKTSDQYAPFYGMDSDYNSYEFDGGYDHTHQYSVCQSLDYDQLFPWGHRVEVQGNVKFGETRPDESSVVKYSNSSWMQSKSYTFTDHSSRGYEYHASLDYVVPFLKNWEGRAFVSYAQSWKKDKKNTVQKDNTWGSNSDLQLDYRPDVLRDSLLREMPDGYSDYTTDSGRQFDSFFSYGLRFFHSVTRPDGYHRWLGIELERMSGTSDISYKNGNYTRNFFTPYGIQNPDDFYLHSYYQLKGTIDMVKFKPVVSFGLNTNLFNLRARYQMDTYYQPELFSNYGHDDSFVYYGQADKEMVHRLNGEFQLRDADGSRWGLNLNGNIYHDKIVENIMVIPLSQGYRRVFAITNISGIWNQSVTLSRTQYLDEDKHFVLDARVSERYGRDYVMYTSSDFFGPSGSRKDAVSFLNRLELKYVANRISLGVNGSAGWNNVTGGDSPDIHTKRFSYGANLNCELPWKINLATDAMVYDYRGYEQEYLNTRFLVWNMLLSRSFLDNHLVAKVQVYDVLKKISDQMSYSDQQYSPAIKYDMTFNSIPSYVMFSLAWRL